MWKKLFEKTKDDLLNEANAGLKKLKTKAAKETGKVAAEFALGVPGFVVTQGSKLAKKYVKDSVKNDNPTGATIGALGESLVKQTVNGITKSVDILEDYLDNKAAAAYRKHSKIPEVEVAKSLFMEYAKDSSMQGKESIQYNGVEFIVDKTEKELALDMTKEGVNIQMASYVKNKDYSHLETEIQTISDDILERIGWLADPATLNVDSQRELFIKEGTDIKRISANYKKSADGCEFIYLPEKKDGVRFRYAISTAKNMEEN